MLDNLEDADPFRQTLLQDDVFRPDVQPEIKELDTYVGNLFVQETENYPKLYWFTQAVTKAYLGLVDQKSGLKLDGIIYPSVAGLISGYNIMLTKDYRDKNLGLTSVRFYQLRSISPENDFELHHIKSLSQAVGSVLTWRSEVDDTILKFNPLVPGSIIPKSNNP